MIDIFRETPDIKNPVITIRDDNVRSIFDSIFVKESESSNEKRNVAEND